MSAVRKSAVKRRSKPEIFVGELGSGGYAVLVGNGSHKIGPNPLPRRAAECVLRIFQRLDLDWSLPQKPDSGKFNAAIINPDRCPKLINWLQNRIPGGAQ